jgi:hypothetical protein
MARDPRHLSAARLADAAAEVCAMARRYSPVGGELHVDRILYGYLQAAYGYVRRQYAVEVDGQLMRIDFYRGTRQATAIELAVRRAGAGESALLPKANAPEIRKLRRLPPSRARTRVLLLMDFGAKQIAEPTLRSAYSDLARDPAERAIEVIYVRRPDKVIRLSPDAGA